MKRDIDNLLKNALRPTDEPDERINRRILNQEKEIWIMRKQPRRIPAAVLTAAIVLGIGSISAVAAWKYLSPVQMAERTNDNKLMEAFQSGDAIEVNETQDYGDYRITLLGVVSGDGISNYLGEADGELKSDRTYAAVAIERIDGAPMPATSDPAYSEIAFLVSPYVKGYNPNWYNSFTLSGGYTDFVQDGVLYRLSECDNMELFADKGVYLGVSEGTFPNPDAYIFDEASGEISRNESFEGVNALFDLPLDVSKADAAAAEEYIRSLEESESEETEIEETDVDRWIDALTSENITEKTEVLESTKQILTPDADGMISYQYVLDDGTEGSGTQSVESLFADGKTGMSDIFSCSYSEDLSSLKIETFILNEDSTITFSVCVPKAGQTVEDETVKAAEAELKAVEEQ